MRSTVHADAAFVKYAESGAYHWAEIGSGLIAHNAFTAERYRTVIDRAALQPGQRVLDYGCGEGALIGTIRKRCAGMPLELHGYDPNPLAIELARTMLGRHRIDAVLHGTCDAMADGCFDRVICTEVIEHASSPDSLLREIGRVLKPGGRLVATTPIRLTEDPEDANHVREWFPTEFGRLFASGSWRVIAHERLVPAAAPEVYFWRPRFFVRVPVFRLLCNLLSIYGDVNAMSWLRMRPRLFMMQMIVAEKAAR